MKLPSMPKSTAKPKPRAAAPRARNSSGASLPARLAHALSALAATLPNPWDESTDYFTPFHAPLDAKQPLDAGTLRDALDVGDRYHLDLAGVDLAEIADDWGGDAGAGFRALDAVMKATLTDITRVSARARGVVRVRTWLIGRFQGWLVGLRTETTET